MFGRRNPRGLPEDGGEAVRIAVADSVRHGIGLQIGGFQKNLRPFDSIFREQLDKGPTETSFEQPAQEACAHGEITTGDIHRGSLVREVPS